MNLNLPCRTLATSPALVLLSLALPILTSCSNHRPAPAPKVGAAPVEGRASFGSEVVVNSTTAKATVVLVDSDHRQIVLKRANGRLAHCHARPGVVDFAGIKAGDTVSIGEAEELALALGKSALPAATPEETARVRVKVPAGVKVLADAVETLTFTAKVVAIDDWNDAVQLQLADGQTRKVRVSEAVNLGDVAPGDDVSVRITDTVVLILQEK